MFECHGSLGFLPRDDAFTDRDIMKSIASGGAERCGVRLTKQGLNITSS